MSDNLLSVWDPSESGGCPASFEDALEIYRNLSSKRRQHPSSVFRQFAEGLLSQARLELADDEEPVRAYGELVEVAKSHLNALLDVQLMPDRMNGLKLVIMQANRCGLIAYDDVAGMLFLPDGSVLPESKRELWQASMEYMGGNDFPKTVKGLDKLAKPILVKMFADEGFDRMSKSPVTGKPVYASRLLKNPATAA